MGLSCLALVLTLETAAGLLSDYAALEPKADVFRSLEAGGLSFEKQLEARGHQEAPRGDETVDPDFLRFEGKYDLDFSDEGEEEHARPGQPVRPPVAAGTPQRRLLEMPLEHRLPSVRPIAWVHIPKCGSSFGNVLIDMPGMCPNIPNEETINTKEYGEIQLGNFKSRWDILGHGCGRDKFAKWGDHAGLGNEEGEVASPRDFWNIDVADYSHLVPSILYSLMYKGHAMGFFRQSEQRIISGFNHDYHDYPKNRLHDPDMRTYRDKVEGCAVKMLTRTGGYNAFFSICGSSLPTAREMERAIVRLREAFVFVGITEKWQASICTFHAMFGGKCRRSDFTNQRVGNHAKNQTAYDLSNYQMDDWQDRYDTRLYAEALNIFNVQRELFNVTQASCAPCLQEAGLEVNPEEW